MRCRNNVLDEEANADCDGIDLLKEGLAVPAVIISVGLCGHECQYPGSAGTTCSDVTISIGLILLATMALLERMKRT